MSLKSKFSLPKTLLASTLGFVFASSTFAAIPTTLKLDYAYYAPTSLVVKDQKLLEKALPNTQIKWVFSQGSIIRISQQ